MADAIREEAERLYREAFDLVGVQRGLETEYLIVSPQQDRAMDPLLIAGYRRARELLEECLRLDPNHVLAHKELAVVLSKLGEDEGVLEHRREIRRLSPVDKVNRYNLAKILHDTGRSMEALEEAKELAKLYPEDVRVQRLLDHVSSVRIRRIPWFVRWYVELVIPILGFVGLMDLHPIDSPQILGLLVTTGISFALLGLSSLWFVNHLSSRTINLGGKVRHVDDVRFAGEFARNTGFGMLCYVISDHVAAAWEGFEVILGLNFAMAGIRRVARHPTPLTWYGLWVLAIASSWAIAFGTVWLALSYLGSATAIALEFVAGAIGGLWQWLVLRIRFKGAGWWILATSIGWGVGWMIVEFIFSPLSLAEDLSEPIGIMVSMMRMIPPPWAFGIVGAVAGLAQWVVLKRFVRQAGWWIPANAIGWAVATAIGQAQFEVMASPFNVGSTEVLGWTLIGLVNGIITGVALQLLLKNSKTRQL